MNDFAGRRTRNFRQDHKEHCAPNGSGYCPCPLERAEPDVAELVCSDARVGLVEDIFTSERVQLHLPVIDLDLPCRLVPSGTPGHSHLYIDRAVTFEQYLNVLKALAEAGIVQWGFVNATQERDFGSVRHPDRPKKAA